MCTRINSTFVTLLILDAARSPVLDPSESEDYSCLRTGWVQKGAGMTRMTRLGLPDLAIIPLIPGINV